MVIILRGGFKLLTLFSKVPTHFKFQRCDNLFQRIDYGTIVREPDGDVFGNSLPGLRKIGQPSYEEEEEEERNEILVKERKPENLVMKELAKSVRALDYDGALKIYRDFITFEKPNSYMLKLVLSCGAELGKAKETFSLFQDVKKRGFPTIHPSMYTSLLIACANCEDSELALRISKIVLKYITKITEKPNLKHCKALLLVFIRHNDMKSAFHFVDHLVNIKFPINTDIYNSLIESCLSNKKYGLRLAVLLYHRMVSQKQLPNIFTFSVIAKCVRDCNFGNSCSTQEFFKSLFGKHGDYVGKISDKVQLKEFPLNLTINQEPHVDDNIADGKNHFMDGRNEEMKPGDLFVGKEYEMGCDSINVLKPKSLNGIHINCDELNCSENRFMMFGGPKGFLETMSDFDVKPNIKLFSLILQCLPLNPEAEELLYQEMKKYNVEPDIYFFNILLLRMLKRNEYETFEEYLDFTEKKFEKPDLWTIGTLSQFCDTKEKVVKLMDFARAHKIRPSNFIFQILINKTGSDLESLLYLKNAAKEEQINVGKKVDGLVKKLSRRKNL